MGRFSVFLLSPYENEEREQIRVDLVFMGRAHAVRQAATEAARCGANCQAVSEYSRIYAQFPKEKLFWTEDITT